jgi:hypothetical protein
MNVRMNQLARSARSESVVCEFCARPWFGLVAYCPYCGRKPSCFTTMKQEPDDRLRIDEALPSGQAILGMPVGELPYLEVKPPRQEPRETPLQSVPLSGETLPVKWDRPAPSQLNRTASTLLFKTVVAGVSALLVFWLLVKLPAPKPNEGTSAQLPISTSGIASPGPGPSTSAAQVPSIPLPTDNAVPARSNKRSLCSVAHETAGLCKSQE